MSSPLGLIEFPSELLDQVSVPAVVSLLLQGLVLEHQLLNFTLESILQILDLLFILIFLCLKLGPQDVELPLGLVILVREALVVLNFLLDVNSVARLQILLDLHS